MIKWGFKTSCRVSIIACCRGDWHTHSVRELVDADKLKTNFSMTLKWFPLKEYNYWLTHAPTFLFSYLLKHTGIRLICIAWLCGKSRRWVYEWLGKSLISLSACKFEPFFLWNCMVFYIRPLLCLRFAQRAQPCFAAWEATDWNRWQKQGLKGPGA